MTDKNNDAPDNASANDLPAIRRGNITDLTPDPHNANAGTERGQYMLDRSVETYGAGRGVLVDAEGNTIAGAKTVQAMVDAGIEKIIVVPTDGTALVVTQRTDIAPGSKEAAGLGIADNRASEVGLEWDIDGLEFAESVGVDLSDMFMEFELEELGYEIDTEEPPEDAGAQVDRAAELNEKWQVQFGDLWVIPSKATPGREHRVLCGDSTNAEDVARLMGGDIADAVVTDPPYGMNLNTDFSGMKSKMFKGKKGGAVYQNVIGDNASFDPSFIFSMFKECTEIFLWGADYYAERIPDKNKGSWLVWDKRLDDSADKMWGSSFELCWSKSAHKRDIIRIKWAGIFGMENQDTKTRVHPTQKPIGVIEWIINQYTDPGAIVADPFLGSGTTAVAAERTGRLCYGMEISPEYVAVILQRLTDLGLEPYKDDGDAP